MPPVWQYALVGVLGFLVLAVLTTLVWRRLRRDRHRSPGRHTASTTTTDASAGSWLRTAGHRAKPTGLIGWIQHVVRGIKRRVVGDPERYHVRGLVFIAVVTALTVFMGLFLAVVQNLDPSANSGPLVRTVVGLLTNFFVYAALSVFIAVFAVNRWWDRAARKTASLTRYSKRTVKRLAQEVKSTDGAVRLIGNDDHSRDQLRAKLLRATAGQYDDDRPGVDEAVREADPTVTDHAIEDGDETTAALPESVTFEADADAETGGDTEQVADVDRETIIAQLEAGSNRAAYLGEITAWFGYPPSLSDLEDLTLVQQAVENDPLLEFDEAGNNIRPATTDPTDHADELQTEADDAEPTQPETASPADDTPADEDASKQTATERAVMSFREAIQTFRTDLAASLNFEEIFWRFIIPAALTVILVFTIAKTMWFAPWVYVIIAAFATLVGTISYGTTKWRRTRKLHKLRQERDPSSWSSAAVLVKRVETPEQTMFVAWMGGRVYAGFDRIRFVEKVTDRWWDRLHGSQVAPAIHEKFANRVKKMQPLLYQMERSDAVHGRKGIQDDIIDVIRESNDPDGMVPKSVLCERVVERGRDQGGFRGNGLGHDPDLVAEVYTEMVGYALTETDVDVTDTDGNAQTITAVHLRWMDVPDDLAEIRAQFANQFRGDDTGGYDLPAVDVAPRTRVAGARANAPADD